MKEMVFVGITPEMFEGFAERARNIQEGPGIEVRTLKGVAGHNGYEFAWDYQKDDSKLTVECIKHPWLFPEHAIESGVLELVFGDAPYLHDEDAFRPVSANPPTLPQDPPADDQKGTQE